MSIELVGDVFLWCTVINYGILLFWALIFITVHEWMYRLQDVGFSSRLNDLTPFITQEWLFIKSVSFFSISFPASLYILLTEIPDDLRRHQLREAIYPMSLDNFYLLKPQLKQYLYSDVEQRRHNSATLETRLANADPRRQIFLRLHILSEKLNR